MAYHYIHTSQLSSLNSAKAEPSSAEAGHRLSASSSTRHMFKKNSCVCYLPFFANQWSWPTCTLEHLKFANSDDAYAQQTWNLSKNLHGRIFGLKILHHQFHLISTVLVRKNTNKWVKMEKFTPLAKILHCRRQWRHGQIPPLRDQCKGWTTKQRISRSRLKSPGSWGSKCIPAMALA